MGNDLYAELCAANEGRFLAFAALPLPHVDQSRAEIARVAGLRSVAGFTVGCSVAEHQLDDPVLDPVLAELDRRRSVVFVHPVGQEATPWLAGHNLAWLVGAPFEDTAAARPGRGAGPVPEPAVHHPAPERHHPVPAGPAHQQTEEEITGGLHGIYYDSVSCSAGALASACRVYGASRLLFGTDYPSCDDPRSGNTSAISAMPGWTPLSSRRSRAKPPWPGPVMTAGLRLTSIDPIACDGRGLCAEMLPGLITWTTGYSH